MQALRNARRIARLVLAWFALSLGVAIASPLVKPADIELVCSGTGAMKLLVKGEGDAKASSHTLDCPLCAGLDAPPVEHITASFETPLGVALQSIPAARIASLAAAALPARGPPAAVLS